jgi:AraC-like DNA-binding protein
VIASDQLASDRLALELDDRTRRRIWQELSEELYDSLDCAFADQPLSVRTKVARYGPVLVDEFKGTVIRATRTARNIAADSNDDFFLGLNCGTQPMTHSQRGREVVHAAGSLILLSNAEPSVMRNDPRNLWLSVHVPRARLLELVANAEDFVARRVDQDELAARFLRNYLKLLLDPDISAGDEQLNDHIGQTLIELVALCLGAEHDAAELAQVRGLKFARLRNINAEIKAGFSQPDFSVGQVAMKLAVTPRYVQELLQETGETFTERVLELRLQKARKMLASRGSDHIRILEVALSCGFNEVSHFNRRFRRRFGDTPSSYRGKASASPLPLSAPCANGVPKEVSASR